MITFEQLLLEVAIDQLRRDWVDSGKMDADLFDMLCQMAGNQSAYATWLVKRVGDDEHWRQCFASTISNTAARDNIIRDWNGCFDIFTKYKQYFDKKDINQYKTSKDVAEWIGRCIEVKQEVEAKKKSKDIDRFKIGTVEAANGVGYVVYKLPKDHEENQKISIELGRHEPGVSGWCTAYDGNVGWWKNHISKEDLYIFINPKDRLKDKFQIQFNYCGSRPFPIKTDAAMNDVDVVPYLPFYDFLHEKEGRPYPKFISVMRETQSKVQEYLQNEEHDTSLEPFRFTDGSYEIVFGKDNLDWLAPVLANILHVDTNDEQVITKLLTGIAHQSSESQRRPYYFVEYGDDDNSFKCVYTYSDTDRNGNVITILQRGYFVPLAQCTNNAPNFYFYKDDDDENRVLYDNLKDVAEKLNAQFDPGIARIFKGFIRADKARARAEAAAARRAQREAERQAARQARQNGQTTVVNRATNSGSLDLSVLEDYKVETKGNTNYYLIHESSDRVNNILASLFSTNDELYRSMTGWVGGLLGIVCQGNVMVFLRYLNYTGRTMYVNVRRVNPSSGIMPGHMNPDTLYELYKVFKDRNNDVRYPEQINTINSIKELGRLERFAIPNVGRATKLYKLPVGIAANMPYTMPRGYESSQFVILGYMSKWQFTLDSNGGFMLTGRWGSGGSRSWIQSVPGLTETLTALCREYNIPVVRALAALQEMCERYGVECPQILQEALLYEVKYL